jgi:hypothetical protein
VRAHRLLLALAAATGAAAFVAGAARANGDPASDVLPVRNVFMPLTTPATSPSTRALEQLTFAAQREKFPIRVAVIAAPADLGLIGSMWKKPRQYAVFLGREIAFAYRGTLVVAMPNGYGVFGPGATPQAKARLASLAPGGSDPERLGGAAATAVRAVALANGRGLPAIGLADSGSSSFWIVVAAVAGALVLLAGFFFAARRWLLRDGLSES